MPMLDPRDRDVHDGFINQRGLDRRDWPKAPAKRKVLDATELAPAPRARHPPERIPDVPARLEDPRWFDRGYRVDERPVAANKRRTLVLRQHMPDTKRQKDRASTYGPPGPPNKRR